MIKWCVEHFGEYTVLTAGLIIAIGPYVYQLIMSCIARIEYSREDIRKEISNLCTEYDDKYGEGKGNNMVFIILLAGILFKLFIIFGSFALGCYIMNEVNELTTYYIHNGIYDQIKPWFWS